MARLSLKKLRSEHPNWIWTAERDGFGWSYHGRYNDGSKHVTFRRYAVSDGTEDGYRSEWRTPRESYSLWWINNWKGPESTR